MPARRPCPLSAIATRGGVSVIDGTRSAENRGGAEPAVFTTESERYAAALAELKQRQIEDEIEDAELLEHTRSRTRSTIPHGSTSTDETVR